jgi:hypothetical protein
MMRSHSGVVGGAVLAALVGACAAISGLNAYGTGECPDGCDAAVTGAMGNDLSDAASDSGATSGADGAENGEDAGAGPDASDVCADELLLCENGCLNPSSPSSCGSCTNACMGDAAVCAAVDAGVFACVSGAGAGLDGGVPCPSGGCPTSAATGFSCPVFGSCNGTSSACTSAGGCLCSNDDQCLSGKCVKVAGENNESCGSNCTGSGGRDGFDCELASPGIPSLAGGTYSCPTGSGYDGATLACDPTHTNCYCTEDSQCPSGECIPSTDNGMCASGGPCSGSGTPDYRGCAPPVALSAGCNGIGYSVSCSIGTCSVVNFDPIVTGVCLCTNDNQCDSGKCVSVSGLGGNSSECGSSCTGSGTADEHSCEPAPTSVPCTGTGGTTCTTTLTPAPVPNSGHSACLCVADSNCSSGKCVNAGQCTGTCTGSAPNDSEDCVTATSVANAWSCSIGNCDDVRSPSGQCTAAGIACWCTSDSQCPAGARCNSWAGCAADACTGSGTGNPFNCVP